MSCAWAAILVTALLGQQPAVDDPASRAPVLVLFASEEQRAYAMPIRDAVLAQMVDRQVTLVVDMVPAVGSQLLDVASSARKSLKQHRAALAFWVEAPQLDRVALYLVGAQEERLFIRNVASEATTEAARIEAIALIVKAATQALAGGPSLVPDTATPAVAIQAPAVERSPADAQGPFSLRLSGGLRTWGRALPLVRHANLAAAVELTRNCQLALAYGYETPVHIDADIATVAITDHPLELWSRWQGLHFGPLESWFEVGLGANWRRFSATPRQGATISVPPDPIVVVGGLWASTLALPVHRELKVVVSLKGDIPFNDRHYRITRLEAADVVIKPAPVRVGGFLGVEYQPVE